MKKKMMILIAFVVVCSMVFPLNVFAQSSITNEEIGETSESGNSNWVSLEDLGVSPPTERATAASDLSPIKYQSQRVSTGSKEVGTLNMKYRTWVVGGRPAFAYDTVELQLLPDSSFYAMSITNISYSNDRIDVTVTINIGLLTYNSYHVFKP